jgi:hypothetical protein
VNTLKLLEREHRRWKGLCCIRSGQGERYDVAKNHAKRLIDEIAKMRALTPREEEHIKNYGY